MLAGFVLASGAPARAADTAPAAAPPAPAAAAPAPAPETKLSTGLYLVHPDDAAGRVQVMLGDQKYFIEPKPVVQTDGIASAKIEHEKAAPPAPGAKAATQPPIGIRLNLTAAGKTALMDATAQNVGMRLAVVADGEVVAMPVIREPVTSGMVVVSGAFAEDRAKQIAATLAPAKAPGKAPGK